MLDYKKYIEHCNICPRKCNINRNLGELGFCHSPSLPKLALVSSHHWEEPPISGTKGSGTVFFSHCNLQCKFCQNHKISMEGFGKEVTINRLAEIFLEQQNKGYHNINLVSPTPYIPQIKDALFIAKEKGLSIPIIYNTNGYENVESLQLLDGFIDIYLPDLKYFSNDLSVNFSSAPNYFEIATSAIKEMYRQCGKNQYDKNGLLLKGMILRHLILPGCYKDSLKLLDWLQKTLGNDVTISLLNQYTPMYQANGIKPLSRRLTTYEYQKVVNHFLKIGLKNGFTQKRNSSSSAYTPIFDLRGV